MSGKEGLDVTVWVLWSQVEMRVVGEMCLEGGGTEAGSREIREASDL